MLSDSCHLERADYKGREAHQLGGFAAFIGPLAESLSLRISLAWVIGDKVPPKHLIEATTEAGKFSLGLSLISAIVIEVTTEIGFVVIDGWISITVQCNQPSLVLVGRNQLTALW